VKLDSLHALIDDYLGTGDILATTTDNYDGALIDFRTSALEKITAVERDLELPAGTLSNCDRMTQINESIAYGDHR